MRFGGNKLYIFFNIVLRSDLSEVQARGSKSAPVLLCLYSVFMSFTYDKLNSPLGSQTVSVFAEREHEREARGDRV